MNAAVQEQLTNYIAGFSEFGKTAIGRELPWLASLRENAFAQFLEVGFPTSRIEDWRYTNVSAIAHTDFQLAMRDSKAVTEQQIASYKIDGAACRMVFVNGHLDTELSSLPKLPLGLTVESLSKQISALPETVEAHLGRYLDTKRDPFSALNTAFIGDGAYVHAERGVIVDAPIHLLFVTTGGAAPLVSHPRNLVIVDAGAELTVLEEYVSLDTARAFCNSATEVVAGDAAIVSHFRIERESSQTFHISTLRVQQGRSANVASHSILLGGILVRNTVHPVLAGEGGECVINGLFIGNGREHLDNYMLVEHASPHCASRQFYNGILDDHAHGVFHGRIVVHKDAQKTDAKQTNRNLLLSDDAQIDTKPQLEIFADDVKCTHGATIGQIEEAALFYLRARGIDELSARRMLLQAFARECLDRMKEGPAREHVAALIHDRVFRMAQTAEQRMKGPVAGDGGRAWEEVR